MSHPRFLAKIQKPCIASKLNLLSSAHGSRQQRDAVGEKYIDVVVMIVEDSDGKVEDIGGRSTWQNIKNCSIK